MQKGTLPSKAARGTLRPERTAGACDPPKRIWGLKSKRFALSLKKGGGTLLYMVKALGCLYPNSFLLVEEQDLGTILPFLAI